MIDNNHVEIHRYSNRKYYNKTISKYVTLDKIINILDEGKSLKVIDFKTKKDITVDAVTKAFFSQGLFHKHIEEFLILRQRGIK
ncbi:MAG: putative PHB/PHA accumulation regulator DNA-binding domain protein [Prokaryotic dsDNA virus sp.]|nr:MAG: putative PHB/PHA accumulation regulator DNA-binding domain protein [Prokaryotic dsDNA virus sp.]|tara:strand:- start:361 stop:612 length:252 start_codon:yes stop_codon:yes gene_type:complete